MTLALGASVLPANNEAGNEVHAVTQPYYNFTKFYPNDPDDIGIMKYVEKQERAIFPFLFFCFLNVREMYTLHCNPIYMEQQ